MSLRSTQNRASCAQIKTSPFPSGGRNPVAEAVSPDDTNLYVVNRGRQHHRPVHYWKRRQALSAKHGEHAGNLPSRCRCRRSASFCHRHLPAAADLLPAAPCSGSIAVFPILTADQADALTPSQPANTLGTAGNQYKHQRKLLAADSAWQPDPCAHAHCGQFSSIGWLCVRSGL